MRAAARRCVYGARVEFGPVPRAITAPVIDTRHLQATADEALLRVQRVGRFHVRRGRHVMVDAEAGVPPSLVEAWLDGAVTALALIQRRAFALHASAVLLDGRLVAVAGPKGVGKSTTVGTLAGRGHPIVTDDVTAIGPAECGDRAVVVQPSGRRLRLLPSTAVRLGYRLGDGEPVGPGNPKRSFPVAGDPGPHPLDVVVALRIDEHAAEPVVRSLSGIAAIETLAADTYRSYLRRLHPAAHLRWLAAIASAVPVVRVDRPARGWSAQEVASAVERVAAEVIHAGR